MLTGGDAGSDCIVGGGGDGVAAKVGRDGCLLLFQLFHVLLLSVQFLPKQVDFHLQPLQSIHLRTHRVQMLQALFQSLLRLVDEFAGLKDGLVHRLNSIQGVDTVGLFRTRRRAVARRRVHHAGVDVPKVTFGNVERR